MVVLCRCHQKNPGQQGTACASRTMGAYCTGFRVFSVGGGGQRSRKKYLFIESTRVKWWQTTVVVVVIIYRKRKRKKRTESSQTTWKTACAQIQTKTAHFRVKWWQSSRKREKKNRTESSRRLEKKKNTKPPKNRPSCGAARGHIKTKSSQLASNDDKRLGNEQK